MKWLILLTSVLVSAKGFLDDTDRTSTQGMLVYHKSEVLFLINFSNIEQKPTRI